MSITALITTQLGTTGLEITPSASGACSPSPRVAARRARWDRSPSRCEDDDRQRDRLANAQGRVPLVLDRPDEMWLGIGLVHKDIRLARRAGDELTTPLPTAAVADKILTKAEEQGYEHRDIAALHQLLAQASAGTAMPVVQRDGSAGSGDQRQLTDHPAG